MICTKLDTPYSRFNYSFEKNSNVRVFNKTVDIIISYKEWTKEYLIIDKWNTLKL